MGIKGSFSKNVSYMSFGTFLGFLLAVISVPIYIRVIGISGYAIIGIVASLNRAIIKLDISFFLGLVKNNFDYHKNKRYIFENMFSTLYNFVLFSNVVLVILLYPLMIFLSSKVYGNTGLMLFYSIALLNLVITRVNAFLNDFIRSNKKERVVQKSAILGMIIEFVLSMVLLLVFDLGVMAIFISSLIRTIIECSMLNYYAKNLAIYRFYFSSELFLRILKKYAIPQYISKISARSVIWIGLFVSTIYLDTDSIGILTIFISIVVILEKFFSSVKIHISPIYLHALIKKEDYKIIKMIKSIVTLSLIFASVMIMLLLAIGKSVYSAYFGSSMREVYFLFILMVCGALLFNSFKAIETYFFVSNIKLHRNINIFLAICFFIILFLSVNIGGLAGVVFSYFIYYCFGIVILLYFIYKKYKHIFDNSLLSSLYVSLASISMILLSHANEKISAIVILTYVFSVAMILLVNAKKFVKIAKYVILEI